MNAFKETDVSQAILNAYHAKFSRALHSDVAIVGSGPSGLVAAWRLAEQGFRVVVIEKRLSTGGGIWGGSMGMNEVVIQEESLSILDQAGVRYKNGGTLYTADAVELASALSLKAIHAGALLLNLMTAEDLCVHQGRVTGVVVNRTLLGDNLPIDPIAFSAEATIDATGHESVMAHCLQRRGLLDRDVSGLPGEGPMNAPLGEQFVVDHVGELFPGLWITGMTVCALHGGPRMGPIFGGMLLSGLKVAEAVGRSLSKSISDQKENT